jgi:hypothetical protein
VIADEIRTVFGDDYALAKAVVGEPRHSRSDVRIGVSGWNDFEQPQVSRRVEEMRAQPVLPKIVAASFCQRVNRNA